MWILPVWSNLVEQREAFAGENICYNSFSFLETRNEWTATARHHWRNVNKQPWLGSMRWLHTEDTKDDLWGEVTSWLVKETVYGPSVIWGLFCGINRRRTWQFRWSSQSVTHPLSEETTESIVWISDSVSILLRSIQNFTVRISHRNQTCHT